jgi:hypothetical protein
LIDQRLLDAPVPVAGDSPASKARRLTQMRDLARRFSAAYYDSQTDAPTELRLLTTPLRRFAAEDSGVIDGGLFAFAISNDPEVFLVLKAIRSTTAESAAYWNYSLARMCSLRQTIRLDDKEIWSAANFYRLPREERKTGPYIEGQIGFFKPASGSPKEK